MVHQEVLHRGRERRDRTWGEFAFDPRRNALIVGCRDETRRRPAGPPRKRWPSRG